VTASSSPPTRSDILRDFLARSPLPVSLGIELASLERDRAVLRLPFRPDLATMGDVVHGGAIATLLDTAGMAGAWADDVVPATVGGSTVALSIAYVEAARGEDLVAVAEVLRRGGSLCFVDVAVRGADDRLVAKGHVTHRYA
jgi:uncharacterized protein (TIGR00369 family)